MIDFFKSKTSSIGLDIGFDSVKMLQLQPLSDRIAVVAADEVSFAPEMFYDKEAKRQCTVSAIKEIFAKGQFSSRDVISCLAGSDLIIKSLRVDALNEGQISEAMKSSLVERSGLKTETHEIRFISAGNVRQGDEIKNEIIIFAIDKKSLNEHINMLAEADVTPVAIDTVPSALFRSFQHSLRRTADREKANVFVDVGGSYTTVIIGRAGEIIFAKQIDIAGEQINRRIASKLGIGVDEAIHLRSKLSSEAEAEEIAPAVRQVVADSMSMVIDALAKEISLCFRYYAVTFRGQRPEQIIFAGGEAYEKTLMAALKKHLSVDIEVTEPLRGFDISNVEFPSDKRNMLCDWAVVAGLAMKGLGAYRESWDYERN